MKTTLALVTVAVMGLGVVADGQSPSTMITIQARQLYNGLENTTQGRGLTIRIGEVAFLSADSFELEPSGSMRLLGNVQLGVDSGYTGSFTVRVAASGPVTLRLLDMVITADGVEPDHASGAVLLRGDVRIRQDRPADIIR